MNQSIGERVRGLSTPTANLYPEPLVATRSGAASGSTVRRRRPSSPVPYVSEPRRGVLSHKEELTATIPTGIQHGRARAKIRRNTTKAICRPVRRIDPNQRVRHRPMMGWPSIPEPRQPVLLENTDKTAVRFGLLGDSGVVVARAGHKVTRRIWQSTTKKLVMAQAPKRKLPKNILKKTDHEVMETKRDAQSFLEPLYNLPQAHREESECAG